MKQYHDAVREVLDTGARKENRTGVDTLSTFNVNYQIDLRNGFPLLTTKEMSWKNIVIENLWFLSGSTDIGLLKKHNCRFWDHWADKDGKVPSAYGHFWRNFPLPNNRTNDQIQWLVDELTSNSMSRRMVVSAWAPGNAQTSALPPCHVMWVVNVQAGDNRPILCLHLTQRSCDMALGVPYNIAGYALLLEILAQISGIQAGIFAHTLVDAHIYTSKPNGDMAEYDHVPGIREQLMRPRRGLPSMRIDPAIRSLDDIENLLKLGTDDVMSRFKLYGYKPHPAIKFKVAV